MTYQNMPEEQRRQKSFQETQQPQAQGWAISGDPLREPIAKAEEDRPKTEVIDIQPVEAHTLEYRTPHPDAPDANTPAPLFGYIGVGIAIAAMLVGLAGMILFIVWFIGWTNG